MKRWIINRPDETLAAGLSQQCDLTPLCIKIMLSRGCKDLNDLAGFFEQLPLEDPFMLKDMKPAVDTINDAIDAFDLICVYGDYDCDGVTATAILYNYLECCGANVMYYIPERDDGYGLNADAVNSLADKGVKLIVTVDNGISAIEEADLIARLGMKLVITDHHQPQEILPKARAVIDPHRTDCPSSFKELAGVGVALKLCAALDGGSYDAVLEQYGDIAAIGTVADVVSLRGENRSIVSLGTQLLKNTENSGLTSLMELSGMKRDKITSGGMAFLIAPRINAAGRFGSPSTAVEMLTLDDESAHVKAQELSSLNNERKQCEQEIIAQIKERIDSDPSVLREKVIVIDGYNWHHGVVGIVAAKIMEAYDKPCVLISIDDSGEARGSARSFKGFNIFKCFSYCSDLLERFGGHECAGGLSLREENIPKLRTRIAEYAASLEKMPQYELHADKLLTREDLTVGQIASLDCLEPFGAGNAQPVFAIIGARVQKVVPLSQGRHTKLEVAYDSTVQTALAFGEPPEKLGILPGDAVDMLVTADINEYNGNRSISLKIKDIRLSGINQQKAFAALECYESFVRNEAVSEKLRTLMKPERKELLAVYKAISLHRTISVDMLMCRMFLQGINFAKTRICVDAFCEKGLARLMDGSRSVELIPVSEKVDLESCDTLRRLS